MYHLSLTSVLLRPCQSVLSENVVTESKTPGPAWTRDQNHYLSVSTDKSELSRRPVCRPFATDQLISSWFFYWSTGPHVPASNQRRPGTCRARTGNHPCTSPRRRPLPRTGPTLYVLSSHRVAIVLTYPCALYNKTRRHFRNFHNFFRVFNIFCSEFTIYCFL